MIKKLIYNVGQWMTCVYTNWSEFIICAGGIAFLLLLCSFAHCETTPEQDIVNKIVNDTNNSIVNKVDEHKAHRWNWEMAVAGVGLAAIGIVDMQDHNAASYICGTPWVIAGGALVVISF